MPRAIAEIKRLAPDLLVIADVCLCEYTDHGHCGILRPPTAGGPDQDPMVAPGDKLYIPQAPVFYITGAVNGSGSYKVDKGMTVRKALARAGGLTQRGSDKKVKVFRDGQEIKAKLDDPIRNGDSITVGERFF